MATDGYVDRWDDVDYNAADERRLTSALLMPGTTPFSARSGRRPGGGGLVTSVVGSPSAARPVLRTSAGAGLVFDPNNAEAGPYRFATPSAVDVTLGDRPGTGASRIDLIVARIRDVSVGVGAEDNLKIEVVQGNPGSSPSAPALPPLSMLVSTINVPASGAIAITNSTEIAVAAGGILPVSSTAEMNKLKTDGIAYRGLAVSNAQTDALHRYDGTNWKRQQDVGLGYQVLVKRWGVDYNPATHVPKRLIWQANVATSTGGVATVAANLATYFAGIASVQMTGSGAADSLRTAKAIITGNVLDAYCYGPGGSGVVSENVLIDVTIDGWA